MFNGERHIIDLNVVQEGEIQKWTNYIHGWQVRYFKLSCDGILTYFLSSNDLDCPRGSVNIHKMVTQVHPSSEVRFDLVTPTVTWYLRCLNSNDRVKWRTAFIIQQDDKSISEEGSAMLLNESSLQAVSDLNLKLDELESFKQSLSVQMSDIRSIIPTDATNLSHQLTVLQATVAGIVATTSTCIDLLQDRETFWKDQLKVEKDKRTQMEILYKAGERERKELIGAQEGPHLNEDEFFDAVESTLDKMDNLEVTTPTKTENKDADNSKHFMFDQMQEIIRKYMELSRQDPEKDDSWQPVSKDGVTKIYRKGEEKGDMMIDFLVALTSVKGVTAAEMAEVFHTKELKLQWDHTIEADKVLEVLDEHCTIIHQILKRVWPAAQRDIVYASHKQKLDESPTPDWIVCNKSCEHMTVPRGTSGYCRAEIEVVLYCKTVVEGEGSSTTDRRNIRCDIVYSATVNPGGWAPSSAVRAISQREYPKFLKKICEFAQNHVKNTPMKF